MKKGAIIAIIIGALLIPGIFLVITIVNDYKIRTFVIPLVIEVLVFLIGGFIWLLVANRKKTPEAEQSDIKEAVAYTKIEVLDDEDNPDNLKVDKVITKNVGAEGIEKTKVVCIYAKGVEKNQLRFIVRVLKNYKKEKSSLINPTRDEIIDAIMSIAEHPATQVTEEIKQYLEHGMPTTFRKIVSPSVSSIKEKEQKEKAEEAKSM